MSSAAAAPPPAAIDIHELWFAYDGHGVIRRGELRIEAGRRVCVIGPNGGGKTTLLKLIMGLLRPDRGTVRIFGTPPAQARNVLGYAPQHAEFDFAFPATVADVVRMGTLGMPRGEARRGAAEAMERTGVTALAHRGMDELSGGQRQRVLIARALACRPRILLMDEPTANLDIGVEQEMFAMLSALDPTMTIVIVSHDVGFVSRLADQVVCLSGSLAVHPTSELTGELLQNLYGHGVRLVHHEHDCREHAGQQCDFDADAEDHA